MSVYTENGYDNRKDYLKCMSDDYGVPMKAVVSLTQLLGPDEDFDGLVTGLEDYADWMSDEESKDDEEEEV